MSQVLPYAFERLREDAGLILYRARWAADPSHILVVAPGSEQPAPGLLKRLEQEYLLRTQLDPAWAIRPLALVRDRGRTLLVLEDPGGEPLDRVLERSLELTRFLRIAIALAAALSKVHGRGIIHKDIKPANIMLAPTFSQVWLTGFGIATRLPGERQSPEPSETVAGTLAYMAPEQTGRMNRSIDSRSDLYSLGVTLYEILTGVLPFTAIEPIELVHCHIARQPPPPRERRRGLPEALSAVVLKLLAKIPEERYQTAAGLEADLRTCLGDWESLGRIEPFVLGSRDASERLLIPEKLYGRDLESKALLEALDRVVTTGTPELMLVSGYSGIGKSSVVNELHRVIVPLHGFFISGKFDQYQGDIPYATLAQAFRTVVRQILTKSEEELARWRDAIRDALAPSGDLMVNLIPELELIIGKQTPVPELPLQEAAHRFHATFRAFVAVFTRREHPVVLFLDDLQWLDIASLNLLEDLVTHLDVRHLLLVGAYRDNEVSPSHPLTLALDSIRKSGTTVREIVLAPLSLEDVGQLIADSLHHELPRTAPLALLIRQKTAGNPFFMIQFLTALAEERLLEFDPLETVWWWDVDRIRARGSTDNVVDLVVGKLNRLPHNTLEILKQLACLGNSVESAVLAMVHGRSEEEIHSDLWEAIHGGFIVHLANSYSFVHDRVQEAAYSLIPGELRAQVHLRIGRLLVARPPARGIGDNIFDVVNQINRGAALISDSNEKQRVAELNLRAGKKARASTAYAAACGYLSVAMSLLGPESWKSRYDLAFNLWLERAECEFLNGNFGEAESLISALLEKAATKTDKAAAYCLRIDLNVMNSQDTRAVAAALDCLRLFGIEMSAHPSSENVQNVQVE
jgi:serine/threonine protein kinase